MVALAQIKTVMANSPPQEVVTFTGSKKARNSLESTAAIPLDREVSTRRAEAVHVNSLRIGL